MSSTTAQSLPAKGYFMAPTLPRLNSNTNNHDRHASALASTTMGQATGATPQSFTLSKGVPMKAAPSLNGSDAGFAGSLPSSVPKGGRRRESIGAQMRKQYTDSTAYAAGGGLTFQRSTGQSILPLFGSNRESSTAASDVPAMAMSLGAAGEATMERRERRGSVSSLATEDDVKSALADGQTLHRCEACNKVYRHPNCLVKHRWEHTTHWKEASRFSMSKHQQVQLLEAAAILVGMDAEAHSLPDEKALWPAAVSPPTSGLLGSSKINFELLRKHRGNARKTPIQERRDMSRSYSREMSSTLSPSSSLPVQASVSPLNGFNMLNLGRRPRAGTMNTDVTSLRLDESAERSVREESREADSDEDEDEDDDGFNEGNDSMTGSTSISAGSPDANDGASVTASSDKAQRHQYDGERYGLGAGGDVMAEMDMEMDTLACGMAL